jgi:phosphogluconate dehydratase
MGYLIGQLLDAGLVHPDTVTVAGPGGLARYREEPFLSGTGVTWRAAPADSADRTVLRPVQEPFTADGGLKLLTGNLGRAVIKISAVKPEHRVVEAPAIVFDDQAGLMHAFDRGELERDFVAVVRYQGPRANGMPELHKLTPPLGVLQDQGYKVALVTDGRMSGASGKVPAAIHVTPECLAGGLLAKVRTGDVIRVDADAGVLHAAVTDEELARREIEPVDLAEYRHGMGRELFEVFRANAAGAEQGGMIYLQPPHPRSQTQNDRDRIHDHFALDVR